MKPGAQYQGGHIIGYAEDEPSKIAKTVLALMIFTQMGKPAFVARLIPVYSLTAEFLFDQVSKLIEIIHENSGFVYMAMNDNLRADQKMFSIFHKTYNPRSLFSIARPIPNDTIDELFLLYPMIQLMNFFFYTQWYNWWTFSSIPNDTIDELFLLYPMIQLMNFFLVIKQFQMHSYAICSLLEVHGRCVYMVMLSFF